MKLKDGNVTSCSVILILQRIGDNKWSHIPLHIQIICWTSRNHSYDHPMIQSIDEILYNLRAEELTFDVCIIFLLGRLRSTYELLHWNDRTSHDNKNLQKKLAGLDVNFLPTVIMYAWIPLLQIWRIEKNWPAVVVFCVWGWLTIRKPVRDHRFVTFFPSSHHLQLWEWL